MVVDLSSRRSGTASHTLQQALRCNLTPIHQLVHCQYKLYSAKAKDSARKCPKPSTPFTPSTHPKWSQDSAKDPTERFLPTKESNPRHHPDGSNQANPYYISLIDTVTHPWSQDGSSDPTDRYLRKRSNGGPHTHPEGRQQLNPFYDAEFTGKIAKG